MTKTTSFSFLVTPTGLTAFIGGQHFSVPTDHPNFTKIGDALRASDPEEAVNLMDVRASVKRFILSDPSFALRNDHIELNGEAFSFPVTEKVLELINAGNAAEPLFNFLRKVRFNPSKTAQDELLLFCVANGFMIDQNGDIVAYKSVRNDYKDIHSGTIENKVGKVVSMPRRQVDDNRDRTCSNGLHFASYEYASTWAGQDNLRLMVLAVNPADVVSIPSDYDNQKGRTAKYTVLAELAGFGRLERKAVYDAGDFVARKSVADLEQERNDEITKLVNSAARQNRLIDELENEIDELNVTIGAINTLGGLAGDDLTGELNRKSDLLDTVRERLSDTNTKLDVLGA